MIQLDPKLEMTNLDAAQWVESQPGLKVTIGKDREINLTDGATIDVTAIGWQW